MSTGRRETKDIILSAEPGTHGRDDLGPTSATFLISKDPSEFPLS